MKELNSENFQAEVDSLKDQVFVIVFSSPTCGPCNSMKPVLEALDANNTDLEVLKVDTSVSPELAAHFGVRGVPTIHFCENRDILYSFTGATPLRDLQYVVNNIDDEYFREHGEFKKTEKKMDYLFIGSIGFIVILLALGILFLKGN